MGERVTDLEKFCLEQIWRPYQNHAGFERRLTALPMSLEQTAEKLREDSEWSRLVLGRLNAIGFTFPNYINHPLVDVVRVAQTESAAMAETRVKPTEAWALIDDDDKIIAMAIWPDYDDACAASYALGGDETRVVRVEIRQCQYWQSRPAPVAKEKE